MGKNALTQFWYRGGKRGTGTSITHYQDADNNMWLDTDSNINDGEIQFRGMQIFITDNMDENDPLVELLYLLEHGRNDEDDDGSIEKAVAELEPMLPEKAEFETAKLCEIVTTLTKFAEFAVTKISILFAAPEVALKPGRLTT